MAERSVRTRYRRDPGVAAGEIVDLALRPVAIYGRAHIEQLDEIEDRHDDVLECDCIA
jgi:hypothetical protein